MSQTTKKRQRTQLFVAQRTRMTATPDPPPVDPPEPVPTPPPKEEQDSHYDIHNRPTLPASHYAALVKDFKYDNPFEREHTSDGTAQAEVRDATAHLGRTATMLEDAQPLLMHDTPIEELSHWCITPLAKHPGHPIISWVQEGALHLRDERTIHHIIGLSNKTLITTHHDAHYTWFSTQKGRLFRFDRKAKKLSLVNGLPRQAPIVLIYSSLDQDRLIVVSRDGKIYTASPHTPDQLERTGRSLPSSIAHGGFDPMNDELILVTTTHKILRIPLAAGTPPQGSSITCTQPITSLHFSPTDRLLHIQLSGPDCVQTYQWNHKPKKMFSATLPEGHHGIYLNHHTQHIQMLCARGSVLLHTPLM